MGGILNENHQHQPGVPSQKHDPDTPNHLRGHSHSGTRMLHPDVISADESETIEIQKKTMDWTSDLAELFGRANTEGPLPDRHAD